MEDNIPHKLPHVCILYATEFRDGYFPRIADRMLIDKADVAFVPIRPFSAENVAAAALDLQRNEHQTDYVAIDLPNELKEEEVAQIAAHVRMLGVHARRVFFGGIKNKAANDNGFYERERVPVVKWSRLKDCQRFNSDEIVRQQQQPKNKSGGLWSSLFGRFSKSVRPGLHL